MTAPPGMAPQPAHAAPEPTPRSSRRKQKITPFALFKRIWVFVVISFVVAAAALTVDRLHGIFGSDVHVTSGYEPIATEAKTSKPKRVLYELTGTTGARGKVRISYYDQNTEPQQIIVPSLPWSLLITTTNTSMAANIMAQTDGDSLTCRITVDDDVKAEKTATGLNALIGCMVKSA
ncbi:MAG: MmpS family transport accessory protein [Segniliparus sp.]|uniref:MmpS family transport accessory protein n=1 Tax=Segniliparus sp. TaxID=2804064 RepID=UPI003F39E6DA